MACSDVYIVSSSENDIAQGTILAFAVTFQLLFTQRNLLLHVLSENVVDAHPLAPQMVENARIWAAV